MPMKIFIEKRLLCLLMALCALTAYAQSDDEYKMEIGAGVGLVSYQGDFNGSILKNQQPAASIVLKRILNPYMALGVQATFGTLKGSSEGLATFYSPIIIMCTHSKIKCSTCRLFTNIISGPMELGRIIEVLADLHLIY